MTTTDANTATRPTLDSDIVDAAGDARSHPDNRAADADSPPWRFRIFIDGGCPLCAKEARLMERLDKGRGNLALEDIAAPDFNPAQYGRTYEQMMASIHGQLPDGRVISGLEVFRQAYAAVGWNWLLGWTRLPGVRWLAERCYDLFARYRLTVTGRRGECDIGACAVPPPERT